jgi:hypothetical protein
MQRKRQRHYRDRSEVACCSTGHAGADAPAAHDERRCRQLWIRTQPPHHRDPRLIEMGGGSGGSATRHPVRLLDPGDRNPVAADPVTNRPQIRDVDAASGSVAQHQKNPRRPHPIKVYPCNASRSIDLHGRTVSPVFGCQRPVFGVAVNLTSSMLERAGWSA